MNSIFFKNKDELEKKLSKIVEEGIDKLHVVSDFDRTLTKSILNGKKMPSTISLLREHRLLSEDYSQKAFALFDKYHPIEIDYSLSQDFRSQKMKEWWESHLELLISLGMRKDLIQIIVKKYPKIFRRGVKKFFKILKENNIPILIFSSGIGDFIEAYLKKDNIISSNTHILSNHFEFNQAGLATGFKKDIIHILNKSEADLNSEKYLELISKRKNIILIGDVIEDSQMANRIDKSIIIKIGFLNENLKKDLDIFLKHYDVVISNDGSLDWINKLLSRIYI